MPLLLALAHADEISQEIIILRPVHQARVSCVSFRKKIYATDQPPISPQVQGAGCFPFGIKSKRTWLERRWVSISEIEQSPGPGWAQLRNEVPPEFVMARLIDDVFAVRIIIRCETHRECLMILRISLLRRMQLASVLSTFSTRHKFRFG